VLGSSDQPLIFELAEWLETPVGQYVRNWEQRKIGAMVANAFGYHAVQVGLPQWNLLESNRISHKVSTHQSLDGVSSLSATPSLYAEPEYLPFESQSIDLLILPHVLECSNNPHLVLREAERVLVPEGRLVISGFNPWSLWGAHGRLPALDPVTPVPAPLQVSLPRLKDWFKLLALEMDRGHFGCYAPPCFSQRWLDRWSFMESAGDRWWPVCGAAYVVAAVKRVAAVRLVGPAWKEKGKRKVRRAAVATSPRRSGHNVGEH
jgi:SAM-dependent methyltransferase|tara:strand:- start:87834 stop:88619 length:786 start_codon:yes stop_codon:yes gene_type:complete